MNDNPVCEQAHFCEFQVVLAVEPPALAGKKNGIGKRGPFFTCAVNAISGKSWFACTIVRAFSVVTESIGVTVMLSCLTLVDVWKIVDRMH